MLGKRLKELRGKRTQQDIADLLQISRARYSHYENEHVQPDNDMLQRMASIYKVSVDYLLGRTNSKEESGIYTYNDLSESETVFILKEIAEKYNVDLTNEENRRKMEDIIKLVFADYARDRKD